MNDYRYSKTASVLDKLVHVIRIFGVFTAIGEIILIKKTVKYIMSCVLNFARLFENRILFQPSTVPTQCNYTCIIHYVYGI